jgi:hypothetical protein|tara:strand:+ start:1310 stop:2533 length:1224 start_codon:yes stop_codon:yes gene_type:complete
MAERRKQLSKTPAQRFEETVEPLVQDRIENENLKKRINQKTVKDDSHQDFSVGIKDIDESIHYYFNNVIRPTVLQNGKKKKVPIIYGNQERWKAVQKDGFYRDKNGKVQAPLIMYKRTGLEKNRSLGNKVDADSPQNLVIFEKKYSRKNFYDRFSILNNRKEQREYQGVVIPDYVTLTYSCIIFTDYIEQNNKIIESINYASDSYWGDPNKFKFRSSIDSYETETDVAQGTDRVTKTTFSITLNGYIIPDSINAQLQGNRKFYSKSSVIFGLETVTANAALAAATTDTKRAASTFHDEPGVKLILDSDSVSMTAEQISYVSLNTTAVANSISGTNTAVFNGKTIATPPSGFTLGQEGFAVYINNTYIPNSQRTVSQVSSNIHVVFTTNDMGYILNSDDEVVLTGKFS